MIITHAAIAMFTPKNEFTTKSSVTQTLPELNNLLIKLFNFALCLQNINCSLSQRTNFKYIFVNVCCEKDKNILPTKRKAITVNNSVAEKNSGYFF